MVVLVSFVCSVVIHPPPPPPPPPPSFGALLQSRRHHAHCSPVHHVLGAWALFHNLVALVVTGAGGIMGSAARNRRRTAFSHHVERRTVCRSNLARRWISQRCKLVQAWPRIFRVSKYVHRCVGSCWAIEGNCIHGTLEATGLCQCALRGCFSVVLWSLTAPIVAVVRLPAPRIECLL